MKKLIAGFMTALIALLTATSPVLAATSLGSYPSFLANPDGTLGAYVVVGSAANVADVVGAIDLATRLAEVGKSATTASCAGGAASINGITKNTIPTTFAYLDSYFPAAIRSFHYNKLSTGTFSWASSNYNYYDDISLGSSQIYTDHDFRTSGINGTQAIVVPTNSLKYEYVFQTALNLGSQDNGKGSVTAPEYSYPININLLGMPFQIVGIGANQVDMLSGSIGTTTATTPVVFGSYSVYSDLGSDATWARVIIKDASGNTVDTLVINQGSSKSSTAAGLTIKVTAVRALTDGTIVGTDLVVGATNAIEKVYPATCDTSGTGSNDYKFPGTTNWCIQASFASTGNVTVGDKIQVVYKPTSTTYIKQTDATPYLPLPNSYGNLGFVGTGFNYNTWTQLTFQPVSGVSGYWDTQMSGSSNSTVAASNLNGIEISATDATTGNPISSIVNGSNAFQRAYILFNYTLGSTSAANNNAQLPVMIGFWDSTNGRISVDPANPVYYSIMNITAAQSSYYFNFTISYSNGAAATDQQFLYVNVTNPVNATVVNGVNAIPSVFTTFKLGNPAKPNSLLFNYANSTAVWSSTVVPQFELGTSTTAAAADVQGYTTDSTSTSNLDSYGLTTQSVVTDAGDVLVTPSTYTGSANVVVNVPAQTLYTYLYVGMPTSGSTGGSTVSYESYPAIPITSAVAKLDSELTSVDKASKNLVAVGGPCVNTVAADALGVTYPACGASSTIPTDAALIKVVTSPYATGKVVLVVAGWEAANTRAATSVMQQYDTELAGVTASSVTVTGTVGSPTVTPVS